MDEKIGGLQREFKRLSERLSAEKRDTQALLCVYQDGLKEVGSALGGLKKDLNEVKASRPTPPQGPNPPELGHLQTEMARVSSFEKELRALGDKVSYLDSTYQNKGLAPPLQTGILSAGWVKWRGKLKCTRLCWSPWAPGSKGSKGRLLFSGSAWMGCDPKAGQSKMGCDPVVGQPTSPLFYPFLPYLLPFHLCLPSQRPLPCHRMV